MPTKLRILLLQEQVIQTVRQFFQARQFHEVIPAVLNVTVPLEPTLYPFETHWQTQAGTQTAYLSISPEKNLKAALAAGLAPCFAVGKTFRNLEQAGSQHEPEFLMLEWYRQNATTADIMTDTADLFLAVKKALDTEKHTPETNFIEYQGQKIDLSHWQTVSLEQLFQEKVGVSLAEVTTDAAMQKLAERLGYVTANATWEQLFNQCFLNEVEPLLSAQPTFLTDFPARISPLCAVQPAKPYLADRFEVYVAGMELGNGNREGTQVAVIRESFKNESAARHAAGQVAQPIDETFLGDLAQLQGHTYAGIGVGLERLMMLFKNTTEIRDVTPFSLST